MTDREKVISDLEEQITWIRDRDNYFYKFPGWGHAVLAMQDALALLKAQEPRMMTFEEAFHNANTYRTSPDSVKPVFVQFRFEEYADEGLCPPWRGGVNQRALLEQTGAYGRDYVFWTDRPTKEQMEAVQWPDA